MFTWVTIVSVKWWCKWLQSGRKWLWGPPIAPRLAWHRQQFRDNLYLDEGGAWSGSARFILCSPQPNSPLISERCRAAWAQVCWICSPPCLRRVQLGGSGAAWSSGPAEPADRPPRRPGPASGWSHRSGSGWNEDEEADETDHKWTSIGFSFFLFIINK